METLVMFYRYKHEQANGFSHSSRRKNSNAISEDKKTYLQVSVEDKVGQSTHFLY